MGDGTQADRKAMNRLVDRLALALGGLSERDLKARALAGLLLLGALLGAVSLVLPNSTDREGYLWALAGLSALAGVGVLVVGDRLSTWALHAVIASGSLFINVGILTSGVAAGLYSLMFFWVVIFCAYFFRPLVVAAHLAWLLGLYGAVLVALDNSPGYSSFTRWIIMAFALGVAAMISCSLVVLRQRAERRTRRFFELSLDMLCTANLDGYFTEVNDAWERALGYSATELCAKPFVEFVHPDDRARTEREASRLFEGSDSVDFENRYRAKDGSWHWLLWRATAAHDEGLIYARATDISERKRAESDREELLAQVEEEARTDPLTGLPNRRWLDHTLEREVSRSQRESSSLCVAMVDLDHFKAFNDRFGHGEGDALLVEAASAWTRALRVSDFLARFGGEEFVAVLPQCGFADARRVMERVRTTTPRGESCSIGIALLGADESPDSVLNRADEALYEAKRAGRDRVTVHAASSLAATES